MIQSNPSSFRDPAGRVFHEGNAIYREIYPSYFADYDHLTNSGLYRELADAGLMIGHTEASRTKDCLLIRADKIPFISYPYEWCFSMLKDAALLTLGINRIALEHGMILKDASAYNIQYHAGQMKLIDTLSFMKYEQGMPWGAYPQFLQHFLAPLLLMRYRDPSLGRLSASYLDGIPVDLAAALLPSRLYLRPALLGHIFAQSVKLPSRLVKKIESKPIRMSRAALAALLWNLEGLVKSLTYKSASSWTHYGDAGSYSQSARDDKEARLQAILRSGSWGTVCDLGCNTGYYSVLAAHFCHRVIAVDADHDCVEALYSRGKFALVVDLTNPSPAIGWGNTERESFLSRLHVDTIMALALIHHISIGNNVPLGRVAELLVGHCRNLIIEFVPLEDPKAQLLKGQKNIPAYSETIFRSEFGRLFNIRAEYPIADSLRAIFVMEAR